MIPVAVDTWSRIVGRSCGDGDGVIADSGGLPETVGAHSRSSSERGGGCIDNISILISVSYAFV